MISQRNPHLFYLDVDYEIDKSFSTDTPEDFNITFDDTFLSNFGDNNTYVLTLVSYNIVRDPTYVPPTNSVPLYLWSNLNRGGSSEFLALLNFDISDNAQSNSIILESNPNRIVPNFKLYFNKRPKDTTQEWKKPNINDKIINVLLRFKLEIYPK